jgi:hypothetical protein
MLVVKEFNRQLNEQEYLAYIEQWKTEHKELIKGYKYRKVFLECLPRKGKLINWKNSINYKVYFIYENVEDWIKIKDYDNKRIEIHYYDNKISISTGDFSNCQLGRILGKVTSEFKVKIKETFKDDKRDLIVIDREYRVRYDKNNQKHNEKWYKYKCNKCNFTNWISETMLTQQNVGCSCCSGHNIVLGYNDIPTTAPWMVKYFVGGYDEAKLYTKTGGGNPNNRYGYINPICPECGQVKNKKIKIYNIYNCHSIFCSCSDKISYPEKIMFGFLKQLGLDFQTQLSKTTFKWCKDYKYDFYFELNNDSYIIETHGKQHYEECTGNWKNKFKEQQTIDKHKKELALANGIKEENYIIIDCRKSELGFIKQNIINSRLTELFDLAKIDWNEIQEFALSNLVKTACEYKRKNPELTSVKIGKLMKCDKTTIIDWLKIGKKLGWCDYDPQKEIKRGYNNRKVKSKAIEVFKDGISKGKYPSGAYLWKNGEKLFGVKFDYRSISAVCHNKFKTHKGYSFKFSSN